MGVLRCAVGALLTVVVALFVAYVCLISIDDVLSSSWFAKLTAACPFPFISSALQASEEEKAVSFLSQDRQYSAAVRYSCHLYDNGICVGTICLSKGFELQIVAVPFHLACWNYRSHMMLTCRYILCGAAHSLQRC